VRRILVIGSGGSGKTTVAKEIARRTGLPLIHLDQLFWRPGWDPTPDDEWDRRIDELIAQDAWVLDGNYGRTLAVRIAAADTVVFLDVPRRVCLWRILSRRLRHLGRSRPDVAPGCPERLTWEFVSWVWSYPSRRRPGILKQIGGVRNNMEVVVLQTAEDVRRFLDTIVQRQGLRTSHKAAE
jgi:adenylate kinase family enzyme